MRTDHEIIPVPDMSELDTRARARLVALERDFCSEEFGEYLSCQNPECKHVLSKQDVYGDFRHSKVPLSFLEAELDPIARVRCPRCSSPCSYFWSEDVLSELTERRHRAQSWGAMMIDRRGEIQGYVDGYVEGLENIWRWEFARTYSHFPRQMAVAILTPKIGLNPIVMSPVVGISPQSRNLSNLFRLLDAFYSVMPKEARSLVMLGDTMRAATMHQIHVSLGAEEVLEHNFQERRCILMHPRAGVPAGTFKNTRAFIRRYGQTSAWRR